MSDPRDMSAIYIPACVFGWNSLILQSGTEVDGGPGLGFLPAFGTKAECEEAYPDIPVLVLYGERVPKKPRRA